MYFTSYSDTTATIAEDVVNTLNVVRNVEKMPDAETLQRFLVDHGVQPAKIPTARDLAEFRKLRPVLRSVFAAEREEEAVATLNGMLTAHKAVPHYTDHDGQPWHLHVSRPDAPPVDQLAANAAMGLLAAISTAGLHRLHTCVGNRCAEVFVDVSRNQSRHYCSPLICGNRATAAAHRARARAKGRPGSADSPEESTKDR